VWTSGGLGVGTEGGLWEPEAFWFAWLNVSLFNSFACFYCYCCFHELHEKTAKWSLKFIYLSIHFENKYLLSTVFEHQH
jgi:hypothetical protein